MDSVLKQIQRLIVKGDEIAAKAQLLEYLDIYPQSADGWWLVSLLADNDSDAQLALKRCLECDGTYYEAKRALGKLSQQVKTTGEALSRDSKAVPQTVSQPKESVKSTPKAKTELPPILSDAANFYIKKGWEVKSFNPQQVTLHKTLGLSWGLASILAVIIPVLGWIIFFGNIFIRRRHEVTLQYVSSTKRVQINGRGVPNVQIDWHGVQRGMLPQPNPNYVGGYLAGVIFVIVACGALVSFVVAFGNDVNQFAVGDIVYIDHLPDNCHTVYTSASYDSPPVGKYPNGLEVVVENIREESGETWYRISMEGNVIGWIPAEYLSEEQTTFTTPFNFCQ